MSDQQIEHEIQSKCLTAPRITPDDIESNISSEHYFTAEDGVAGWFSRGHGDALMANEVARNNTPISLSMLTFCVLELRNGYTVTGESACVSHENFNKDIGRKIARDNAIKKVWPLMGYQLKQKLHEEGV